MADSVAGLGKMAARDEAQGKGDDVEDALRDDDRWLLVQRIVESRGFERALQLRKILLYVTKCAILEPDRVVREYDIAREVLERRADFDPASDNIVRSQFSNLRRKLDIYFAEGSPAEPLIVKVPKGSYLPVFVAVRGRPQEAVAEPSIVAEVKRTGEESDFPPSYHTASARWWQRKEWIFGIICLLPSLILAGVMFHGRNSSDAAQDPLASDNAFVHFMAQWKGDATIIVPDTSLVVIKNTLTSENIPLSEYTGNEYPAKVLEHVKDPSMRGLLAGVGRMRNTTFNEAMIASDFVATMRRTGLNAKPRFARDLRVSDLNEGNTVVIGGEASDPWLSLFADKMNFRFIDDRETDHYYFTNAKPAPGEQPTYQVTYSRNGGNAEGYVDIGLTQNPSHTGYVLLIAASDQQEAEAGANLLLHGKLPPEIAAILARKDLHYFEFFFRGKHIAAQADSSLELVALRPPS